MMVDEEESKEQNIGELIRLPNLTNLKDPNTGQSKDGYASPTSFLGGANNNVVLDSFMTKSSEQVLTEYEGEMLRKTPDGKFKKYWFCLLGKELYCYRKRDDEKHKGMHSLVSVFVSSE